MLSEEMEEEEEEEKEKEAGEMNSLPSLLTGNPVYKHCVGDVVYTKFQTN